MSSMALSVTPTLEEKKLVLSVVSLDSQESVSLTSRSSTSLIKQLYSIFIFLMTCFFLNRSQRTAWCSVWSRNRLHLPHRVDVFRQRDWHSKLPWYNGIHRMPAY